MFYFKEYSDYYFKKFPDAYATDYNQIAELFGKGLSNKVSKQLSLQPSYSDKKFYISINKICMVSILDSNLQKIISKRLTHLISKYKDTPNVYFKPFKNSYYHVSWLSLDHNYNNNLSSLLYKQMRSYDFLKLANQLNDQPIKFNSIKEYCRKNGDSIIVIEPDENSIEFTLSFRKQLLHKLNLSQPDEHLTMPPHISLMRLKNGSNNNDFSENLTSFIPDIRLENLTILRNLNRIPDQPLFSVIKENSFLPFD